MYLYRLYNAADVLLYVGITSDPESRFKNHSYSSSWWRQVARRDLVPVDPAQAHEVEWRTIREEAPVHNKVGARKNTTGNALGSWGANLTAARIARGLQQLELAALLDTSGACIQRWEAGTRRPSEEDQNRLARALRTSVTELLPRSEDEAELVVLAGRLGTGCS